MVALTGYTLMIYNVRVSVRLFTSGYDLLLAFPGGWFFAIFEKCTILNHNNTQINLSANEHVPVENLSKQKFTFTAVNAPNNFSETDREEGFNLNAEVINKSKLDQVGLRQP